MRMYTFISGSAAVKLGTCRSLNFTVTFLFFNQQQRVINTLTSHTHTQTHKIGFNLKEKFIFKLKKNKNLFGLKYY